MRGTATARRTGLQSIGGIAIRRSGCRYGPIHRLSVDSGRSFSRRGAVRPCPGSDVRRGGAELLAKLISKVPSAVERLRGDGGELPGVGEAGGLPLPDAPRGEGVNRMIKMENNGSGTYGTGSQVPCGVRSRVPVVSFLYGIEGKPCRRDAPVCAATTCAM